MEDQFKRLASVVARVLNVSEATVADAVESDEAVKSLTTQFKEYRNTQDAAGYQRADAKIKDNVEKALKAAGVEDASFDKLTEGLSQLEALAREKGGTRLSDDDVLKHPAVTRLKNQFATEKEQAVTAAKSEAEKALEQREKDFLKKRDESLLDKFAREEAKKLNPILSTNPTIAANQFEALVEKIKSGPYKVEEGKEPIPLKPGTEEYDTDEHGHPIKFSDKVRDVVTSLFDLPVATERQSAGLTPEQVAAGQRATGFTHFKGQAPKTEDEYQKLANDPALPVLALQELGTYWKEQSKAG